MALRRRAERLRRSGNAEAALTAHLDLARALPGDAGLWNAVGDLQERLGRLGESASSWARAAEIQRTDGFVHKAIALLRKVRRAAPDDLEAMERLAALHERLRARP
ncbi:MAG: hypothetical protein HY317_01595 [Acidobacteria bacterium]|nr:hypothetical protein [Acidobacteriota bacterium]